MTVRFGYLPTNKRPECDHVTTKLKPISPTESTDSLSVLLSTFVDLFRFFPAAQMLNLLIFKIKARELTRFSTSKARDLNNRLLELYS